MRASTVSGARPVIWSLAWLVVLAIVCCTPDGVSAQRATRPRSYDLTACGHSRGPYLYPRLRTDTVPHPACPGAVDVKAKIRLSPRPTYPSIFKSMDGDLSTLVQFVIDEHGRIDSNSIVVYTPPHQDFTDSIRHAMVRWKGTPARVAGRAVAQWALVNFEFAEECPARSTEPRWLRGTATLCVSRR